MNIKLHANAKTTPLIRKAIHESPKSVKELCLEFNLNHMTVRKWRKRDEFLDRSHTRHNLGQSTTPVEEALIVELRQRLGLSIDDTTEVMNRCVNATLSRSAIYRCLRRNGAHELPGSLDEEMPPVTQSFAPEPFGYVHIDLKHLTRLQSKPAYVFVAIERNTRFVWVDILNDKKGETIAKGLLRFIQECHFDIHTILTDNGSEFTDRFAEGKKDGKPTGHHPFDQVCQSHNIKHKLTKPYHPQTNGMVERFNRRLNQVLRKAPIANPNNSRNNHFTTHEQRNRFIKNFVKNYNNTRLRSIQYQTPNQLLSNHTELYTSEGCPSRAGWLSIKGQSLRALIYNDEICKA